MFLQCNNNFSSKIHYWCSTRLPSPSCWCSRSNGPSQPSILSIPLLGDFPYRQTINDTPFLFLVSLGIGGDCSFCFISLACLEVLFFISPFDNLIFLSTINFEYILVLLIAWHLFLFVWHDIEIHIIWL